MIRLLTLFVPIMLIIGCSSTRQTVVEEVSVCGHKGVFRSFEGISACNLLLVLQDGTKLQVLGGAAEGIRFSDGMEVRVDYEEVFDMASACMASDALVRLTCVEVLVYPERECANKVTVFKRNWMMDAIQSFNPEDIRIIETDSLNYFRLRGTETTLIFDCYGKIECFIQPLPSSDSCRELNENFEKAEIIWILNH